jgi:putative hemolysin
MWASPPSTSVPVVGQVAVFGVEVGETILAVAGAVVILVLLALSGFFSSSEIAMFSLAKHRIDALVDEGRTGA